MHTPFLLSAAGFALFGITIKGFVQFFWYGLILDRLSGGRIVLSVLLDEFLYMPLVYFPLYYACTDIFQNNSSILVSLRNSLKKYFGNFWGANRASVMFWVPLQTLNFCVVPLEWRNIVVLSFAFSWTVILSLITD